jgi:hypothetical protein
VSLTVAIRTGWADDRLRNHPEEALEVESMRRTSPVHGTLRLTAKSARGPFVAIVNTAESGFDGYRGYGPTYPVALRAALAKAQEAAA